MTKRYVVSRRFLIFWTLFIGVGAVFGSLCMLIDPSGKSVGMDAMLPYFQVLPFADKLFQDFVFSGIMLLIVNGISNLTAAGLLFARRKSGIILGTIFGVTLMAWIVIQFVIFPFNFMSTIYFIFGFLQFVTGYTCFVGYNQSQFRFDENDYKNIQQDSKKLVIYFSRLGYTKKLAYTLADSEHAQVVGITPKEKIDGDLGFWWCGRFGMHKWGMKIEDLDIDFSKYDEITICTPTWVFGVSSPVREFCMQNAGKIKNVNYVVTHFMNCKFGKVAKQMDDLLGVKHQSFRSFRCRFGKLKEIK